jgi:4-hydroxybenzoyl-CoA thioesterase/acyl-CoA thioester hydrolase
VIDRRVEFRETDAAGIAHFASFFGYMEEAEHAMLRDLGLSVMADYGDYHISWPRVSAKCDYRSPARFEEILRTEVSVLRLGTKAVTYGFRFTIAAPQQEVRLVAEGEIVAVCCRFEAGEPPQSIAIPAEMVERLRERLVSTPSS